MTELGCSSSSDRGFNASAAAFLVSSCSRSPVPVLMDHRGVGGGGFASSSFVASCCSPEISEPSLSIAVSSISEESVPLEMVVTGEGPAISLGLVARGEDWLGGFSRAVSDDLLLLASKRLLVYVQKLTSGHCVGGRIWPVM